MSRPSYTLLKRLIANYIRPFFPQIAFSIVLMAIAGGMTALLAKTMEPIINDIFIDKDRNSLIPTAATIFGAFALRGFATYGHSVILNSTGQRVVSQLQKDLYRHSLGQDMAFFHTHKMGELLIRLTSDVTMLRIMVSDAVTALGKNAVTLIFLVGLMFYQDWHLAIAAFIVFPISAWGVSRLGKSLRRTSGKTQTSWAQLTSLSTEVFQGVRQVKAYGMEQYETDRAYKVIDRLYYLIVKSFRTTSLSAPIGELLSALAIATIILYGGNRVMAGQSTPGELFSFILAFILAYEPMKKLATVNATLQTGLASSERIFAVLDTPVQIVDAPDAKPLIIKEPRIELRNITFSYDDEAALHNITIDIPAGKKVALVGPSGAGKSTILNLIPRFYDVQQGEVLINGQNVRNVTLESLRRQMSLVSQDIAIFDDTVAMNISYGSREATKEQIVAAAKSAHAHDFIMTMPDGYETRLGEQGTRLSGGQRQRIAIARAMLRNPPILLLDEATSALDTESERAIVAALGELQQGRTTLVVAHRLSTVRDADLIYVLDKGRVAESGSHAELMTNNGLYARLYGLQLAH